MLSTEDLDKIEQLLKDRRVMIQELSKSEKELDKLENYIIDLLTFLSRAK